MLASLSRALRVVFSFWPAALFFCAGCDRVPDVVIRVLGVPADTQVLKASLWQLRAKADGGVDPRPGSPIPAFSYTAPTLDASQLANSDPELRVFKFGAQVPDDENVFYSIDVAAFQTFGTRHCLLGVTQPTQVDGIALRRGTINLPQEFSVVFDVGSTDPRLLGGPDIEGNCLSDSDTDTRPLIEGLHLTFDQSRRLGDSTTALVRLSGWNMQPGATVEAAEIPKEGDPVPSPFPFPLLISSPSQITVIGIPALIALGLIDTRIRLVLKNPDGQTSAPFVATPIML